MGTVRLRPGHVQPVWAGHPWVYAQAVEHVDGGAVRGDEVRVTDPRGNLLGRGFYSPGSAIVVRLLVRDERTPIDSAFFEARIARALERRKALGLAGEETTGYRLVHAEGDGLPGLIVDVFGDVAVVQLLTAGVKQRELIVLGALERVLRPRCIIDRTPASVAKLEGFTFTGGVVRGEAPKELQFKERGLSFSLSSELGQKTGFYFDQRGLRARIESLAKDKRVLDAYAYVGSFSLFAARGGAKECVAVDESALALEVGAEIARDANLADRIRFECGDARRVLADAHGSFDLVIVDPPRLAPTRAARDKAMLAYAKLAELGARATKPEGLLVFCSCSAAIDIGLLARALATGALRANVQATVLERSFQGVDHPVPAAFGEGLYLKALIARIEPR